MRGSHTAIQLTRLVTPPLRDPYIHTAHTPYTHTSHTPYIPIHAPSGEIVGDLVEEVAAEASVVADAGGAAQEEV